MNRLWIGLASILVLVVAIGAYIWFGQAPERPPAQAVSPPAITPAKPAISPTVEAPPVALELPPLGQADEFVRERIAELLDGKAIKTFLRMDNFVRRFVATVDNLPRSLAPPRMWPINPIPGRFTVEAAGGGSVIGAKNAARYAPFVALAASVDTGRAVALYQRLYPLLQRAYEELGYPGKSFNDRLVAVIDHLLETPDSPGPLKVELPAIQGPLKPTRPWVLYRFSDSDLEGLSGGQKILLRVGRENEKRLKAKLAEIRKLIAGEKAGR